MTVTTVQAECCARPADAQSADRSGRRAHDEGPATAGESVHPIVMCVGDAACVPLLEKVLPEAHLLHVQDTAELVRNLESGMEPALVVAALENGQDPAVQTLATLKAHPHMPRHGVYLRLNTPLRTHVVRCGRLGLVNVIAADADEQTLRARLGAALTRHLKAAAR